MAEKKTKNLCEKMLEVMKSIEYLQKDDLVSFGSTNYKALSEEKVTTVVRQKFVELGIVVFPIEQEVTKEGNITTTNTKYKMVNAENPEDYVILASSGQGSDTQDKGVGKAMTYSYKYMLLRTFAIPTGEDTDKISSEELDSIERKQKEKASVQTSDNVEVARANLKGLLERTNSDVAMFLVWCGKTFKREIKSVDELELAEVNRAIAEVSKKKEVK